MKEQDIFKGYAAYSTADELGLFDNAGGAPAFSPITTSSALCSQIVSQSISQTVRAGC
ncbi:LxmA leader domain family RiPP [Arthrobacter sp. Z1-15]